MISMKMANRMFLAAHDISEAGEYLILLDSLLKNKSIALDHGLARAKEAALIAAVISYSRPFVSSYSNGMADKSLSVNDINMFCARKDLEAMHNHVINLRNQAVGHSDWAYHSTIIAKQENDDIGLGFVRDKSRPDCLQLIDVDCFSELIRHVYSVVSDKAYEYDCMVSKSL